VNCDVILKYLKVAVYLLFLENKSVTVTLTIIRNLHFDPTILVTGLISARTNW